MTKYFEDVAARDTFQSLGMEHMTNPAISPECRWYRSSS